jgi:hypothetical protein
MGMEGNVGKDTKVSENFTFAEWQLREIFALPSENRYSFDKAR